MTSLLDPIEGKDWDARKARHLLNRAGFGVPLSEVDRIKRLGPTGAVNLLVDFEDNPHTTSEPDWLQPPKAYREMMRQMASVEMVSAGPEMTAENREAREEQRRRMFNAFQAEERRDTELLKRWWLSRMLKTRRPLEEKMTLFWHGHFATSGEKVRLAFHNYHINKLFRDYATGNFKLLAYEVGISPAMMEYLDNARNNKFHPNENWARELMELFTMGKGNYTEDDVKNSARAWTGWSSDGEQFVYRPELHDETEKTFLGKTGNFSGNDIIDIIFEQECTSRFIATKLWNYFADDNPEPSVIEGLAKTLRESGYEIKPMLRQLFRSQAFYSDRTIGTQIKSPAQLVVSMLSHLEVDPPPGSMVELYCVNAMRMMGQDLFFPPNVKGWEGGKTWINTNTLMTRYNLSDFLVAGVATDMGPGMGIQQMLERQRRAMTGEGRPPAGDKAARAREAMMGEMSEMTMEMGERGMMMDPVVAQEMDMVLTGEDMKSVGIVGDSEGPKGLKLPFSPFDAQRFFTRANGLSLDEIATHLSEYFCGMQLSEDQRVRVIVALAGSYGSDTPMDASAWDVGRLRGGIRLLLSTAEFQVC